MRLLRVKRIYHVSILFLLFLVSFIQSYSVSTLYATANGGKEVGDCSTEADACELAYCLSKVHPDEEFFVNLLNGTYEVELELNLLPSISTTLQSFDHGGVIISSKNPIVGGAIFPLYTQNVVFRGMLFEDNGENAIISFQGEDLTGESKVAFESVTISELQQPAFLNRSLAGISHLELVLKDCAVRNSISPFLITVEGSDQVVGAMNLTLIRSVFEGNTNGAFHISAPWEFNIFVDDCRFVDNENLVPSGPGSSSTHRNNGGAFCVRSTLFANEAVTGEVTLRMSVINTLSKNNHAFNGGSFSLENNRGDTIFNLSSSRICDNIADKNGGGLYMKSTFGGTELNVFNSTIESNYAEISGGGTYAEQSRIDVFYQLSSILNNHANTDGGGIFIQAVGGPVLAIITESLFFENEGRSHGGGVYIIAEDVSIQLFDAEFSENSALSGGGIYVKASDSTEVNTFNGTLFFGNSAEHGGGIDITSRKASIHIQSAEFTRNNFFYQGAAFYGSALSVQSSEGAVVTIASSRFQENKVAYLGYVYVSVPHPKSECLVEISDSTFFRNTGGVYVKFESPESIMSNVLVSSSVFQENLPSVREYYCGFKVKSANTVKFFNVSILDHDCTPSYFWMAKNVTIEESAFINNDVALDANETESLSLSKSSIAFPHGVTKFRVMHFTSIVFDMCMISNYILEFREGKRLYEIDTHWEDGTIDFNSEDFEFSYIKNASFEGKSERFVIITKETHLIDVTFTECDSFYASNFEHIFMKNVQFINTTVILEFDQSIADQTIHMEDVSFIDTTSLYAGEDGESLLGRKGGAMCVSNKGNSFYGELNILNGEFEANVAEFGGAIYFDFFEVMYGFSNIHITGSNFFGNYAENQGGAIYVFSQADSSTFLEDLLDENTFSGNIAGRNGENVTSFPQTMSIVPYKTEYRCKLVDVDDVHEHLEYFDCPTKIELRDSRGVLIRGPTPGLPKEACMFNVSIISVDESAVVDSESLVSHISDTGEWMLDFQILMSISEFEYLEKPRERRIELRINLAQSDAIVQTALYVMPGIYCGAFWDYDVTRNAAFCVRTTWFVVIVMIIIAIPIACVGLIVGGIIICYCCYNSPKRVIARYKRDLEKQLREDNKEKYEPWAESMRDFETKTFLNRNTGKIKVFNSYLELEKERKVNGIYTKFTFERMFEKGSQAVLVRVKLLTSDMRVLEFPQFSARLAGGREEKVIKATGSYLETENKVAFTVTSEEIELQERRLQGDDANHKGVGAVTRPTMERTNGKNEPPKQLVEVDLAMKVCLELKPAWVSQDNQDSWIKKFASRCEFRDLPIHLNIVRTLGMYLEKTSIKDLFDLMNERNGVKDEQPDWRFMAKQLPCLFMPFCKGTVQYFVDKNRNLERPIFKKKVLFLEFLFQVVTGLCVLKTCGKLVHCDIKANNLFYSEVKEERGSCTIFMVGDFDRAEYCDESSESDDLQESESGGVRLRMDNIGGCGSYKPPEVLRILDKDEKYTRSKLIKYDPYSLGCVCHILINSPQLKAKAEETGDLLAGMRDRLDEDELPYGDSELRDLINAMLSEDYKKRISLEEILKKVEDMLKKTDKDESFYYHVYYKTYCPEGPGPTEGKWSKTEEKGAKQKPVSEKSPLLRS